MTSTVGLTALHLSPIIAPNFHKLCLWHLRSTAKEPATEEAQGAPQGRYT